MAQTLVMDLELSYNSTNKAPRKTQGLSHQIAVLAEIKDTSCRSKGLGGKMHRYHP